MIFAPFAKIVILSVLIFSSLAFGQQADPKKPDATDETKIVKARIYRDKDKAHITGLSVLASELPIFFVPKADLLQSYVDLPLKFIHPGWELKVRQKVLLQRDSPVQSITVPIYLKPKMNSLILTATGPQGETETESIYIFSPEEYERSKSSLIWDTLLISGGIANLDYTQTGTGIYKSLTGLIAFEFASAPQNLPGLSYYVSADLASPTFWESPVKAGSQLVEAKADLGYFMFTDKTKKWRYQFLAGGSFLTLFANNSPFGFSSLIAPDFGYRAHYMLDEDSAFILDFRYVALGMPTQFDTYGIDLNSAYTFKFSNNHRGQIGVDIFSYQFTPAENRQVKAVMLKIMMGYSF